MDKKTGILIVIIIVVLGLLVGGYFLFFAPKDGEEVLVESYYSPGDAFITNVSDAPDSLLKVTLTLGTSRNEEETLTLKNAVLRDTILQVLREATMEELQSPAVQKMLSERICLKLNEILDAGNITYVMGGVAADSTTPAPSGEDASGESTGETIAPASTDMVAQYIKTPLFTQVYFTDLVMQ